MSGLCIPCEKARCNSDSLSQNGVFTEAQARGRYLHGASSCCCHVPLSFTGIISITIHVYVFIIGTSMYSKLQITRSRKKKKKGGGAPPSSAARGLPLAVVAVTHQRARSQTDWVSEKLDCSAVVVFMQHYFRAQLLLSSLPMS